MAGTANPTEYEAMARAIALARTPKDRTHPNPRVGAVLLNPAGVEVGSGFHGGAGQSHAEVAALEQAGNLAQGATAVVSLEPCSHIGRTGPCTEALLEAGVARVVFGQADPNPLASGGADALVGGGIEVVGGVLAEEAQSLNSVWSFAMVHQRPLVTWKFAATLDGRIAAEDGSSQWISGAVSRAEVHRLRAYVDAVVVGTGTVLADDPQLTARDETGTALSRQPLRVVIGARDVPPTARVLDGTAPTLIVVSHDVDAALGELFARDVHHLLLEGGPTLAAAFLQADRVDQIVAYVGPRMLGAGRSVVGMLGVETLADALEISFDDVCLVGGDLRWTARVHDFAPRYAATSPVPTPGPTPRPTQAPPLPEGRADVHRNH